MATNEEQALIERLKKHPELQARITAILDIAEAEGGGPDTADAVESRALNEVRRLGNEVMTDWAKGKAERAVNAHKERVPHSRIYKKKQFAGTHVSDK